MINYFETSLGRFTLFLCLFTIYFFGSAYITCPNDGSHFALVSSLVNDYSSNIRNYVHYTEFVDFAVKNGSYFSDRLPGVAFIAIPFYLLGLLIEKVGFAQFLSNYSNIKEIFVVLLPNIMGAFSVLLYIQIFTWFKFSFKTSLFSALIFSFATMHFLESTHLFSHFLSMFTMLACVLIILKLPKVDREHATQFYLAVALFSYSTIVELQNILFAAPLLVYLLQKKKLSLKNILKGETLKVIVIATVLFLAIFSMMVVYNYLTFHEFTIKSSKYNPTFPEEKSFMTALSGSIGKGFEALLVRDHGKLIFWFQSMKNEMPSILMLSPIFWFAIFRYKVFFRKFKAEAILFFSMALLNIVIAAAHETTLTRHVFTIFPYIFFPIAFYIEDITNLDNKKNLWLFLLFIFLLLFSVARNLFSLATFYNRAPAMVFGQLEECRIYLLVMCIFIGLYITIKPRLKAKE